MKSESETKSQVEVGSAAFDTSAASSSANEQRSKKMQNNENAARHRHYSRKVKLTGVSLAGISRQNGIGREVVQKAETIIAEHGGREAYSELQVDLVDHYVKTELLLSGIDAWLFAQPTLVNKRRKSAYPILAERNRLVETSLKLAQAIGLERKARQVPSLADYLREKSQEQK